jgi:cytochrome b561
MDDQGSMREAMLRDLDIQWRDHFHMRDQTWRTVTNSVLLFLGVIGLEFKGIGNLVMIPAYLVVIMMALFGWVVAGHHRLRQSQKFTMITMYEKKLELFDLKKDILEQGDAKSGFASKAFTAVFIHAIHISIGVVAFLLLIRRLLGSA